MRALPVLDAAADAPARQGWQQAIAATVQGLGYDLVDVERAGRGLLRVTIDRIPGRVYGAPGAPDAGEFITVEDCEAVTRQLQYVLEVEGLEYARLEVSSPGLDRPLRHDADYRRFAGQAVRITLREPFEGRKHWEGVLGLGTADGSYSLTFSKGTAGQQLGFVLAYRYHYRSSRVGNRPPPSSGWGGAVFGGELRDRRGGASVELRADPSRLSKSLLGLTPFYPSR